MVGLPKVVSNTQSGESANNVCKDVCMCALCDRKFQFFKSLREQLLLDCKANEVEFGRFVS